ncbi:MAG TPA: hypothetical protein VMT67_16525 [Terriglobales bacterium]|nr:hypothetical protein [Terriglobales bacterium]
MKKLCLLAVMLSATAGFAMPIASSARSMVPAEIQQLFGIDYSALKDSPTAMQLKDQVLPPDVKSSEASLKTIGIDVDRDLTQLNVANFRTPKVGLQTIYIAQGSFSAKAVLKKMKLKKISGTKYGTAMIYPMGGFAMTFLDDNTMAYGSDASLRSALDTRDGKRSSLDSNPQIADQMAAVDGSSVWSVLDQEGTQAMMRSALGDAASKIADYETVKKRIQVSRYTMNFQSGVNFDLSVQTADSMTAATLATLVKGGILFKKMNASAAEKNALDATTVDNDGETLVVHFKEDDGKFQALLKSPLFAAVSH